MLIPKFEYGKKIYEDLFGNKYQYDLSNPIDQREYSMDIDAQMRDKLSVNPTKQPNGGGIYEK